MGYDNCGYNSCCNYGKSQGGTEWIWIIIAIVVILCLCGDNNIFGCNDNNSCC
ncbi:MAG: hypothetical protein PHE51_06365 [Eubacteriales bacterium]|nr:hypothetical protein [Eubacteriales bacterium]